LSQKWDRLHRWEQGYDILRILEDFLVNNMSNRKDDPNKYKPLKGTIDGIALIAT